MYVCLISTVYPSEWDGIIELFRSKRTELLHKLNVERTFRRGEQTLFNFQR